MNEKIKNKKRNCEEWDKKIKWTKVKEKEEIINRKRSEESQMSTHDERIAHSNIYVHRSFIITE